MLRGVAPAALLLGALLAAATPAAAQEPVALGLVLPGGAAAGLAAEARAAAEEAVAAANREGGFRGRPFALRVVSEDGLWGQGLGRVVALAFDGPVRGIIGGFDGRSAHLIQQVVIKARVPFLTPWASDPTLSRGMIPWFFQLVPDDRRQAAAMVDGTAELVLVADSSYDARQLAEAVVAAAAAAGVEHRRVDPVRALARPGALAPRSAASGRVVLATGEEDAVRILERLATLPSPPTVCVPLRLAVEPVRRAAERYPGRVLAPAAVPDSGRKPGPEAGAGPVYRHTREAVEALVAAIRSAGVDPWEIRDALAGLPSGGADGPAFDAAGRRRGPIELVEVVGILRRPAP